MSTKERKLSNHREKDLKLEKASQMPLVKINFILMGCSAALIIIGFLLMLGGSSTAEGFQEDIFSSRRIIVGPTIAFIGFVAMGISIIYRPKEKEDVNDTIITTDEVKPE